MPPLCLAHVVGSLAPTPNIGAMRLISTLRLALVALGLISGVSCSGPALDSEKGVDSNVDATSTSEGPVLDCGGPDFPCAWEDVLAEVDEAGADIARDALLELADGAGLEEVAAAVAGREAVVEVDVGETAVRFRLHGGRPEWVFAPATDGSLLSAPPAIAHRMPADESAPVDPLGPQQGKPRKKALILSPFHWQWTLEGKSDESDSLAVMLAGTRDYAENGVDLKKNELISLGGQGTPTMAAPRHSQGVTLSDFAGWGAYHAIHVSTHGGVACRYLEPAGSAWTVRESVTCKTTLSTGLPWSGPIPRGAENQGYVTRSGFDRHWVPVSSAAAAMAVGQVLGTSAASPSTSRPGEWSAGAFLGLSTDYFRLLYPNGLEETLVFLSGCSTAKQSDLIRHLSQRESVVVGWTQDMNLSDATTGAVCFWRTVVGDHQSAGDADKCGKKIKEVMQLFHPEDYEGGATVRDAFLIINDAVGAVAVASNGTVRKSTQSASPGGSAVTGALAGAQMFPSGDQRNRAIEIVRLVEAGTRREYEDGDLLELTGEAGDGAADTLIAELEIFGLGPSDTPDKMTLHVDVDGVTQSKSLTLTQQAAPGRYRTDPQIPLDIDLTPNTPIDVEVWAEYPDGTTRWRYERLEHGCNAPDLGELRASFDGPFARSLTRGTQANRAQLVRVPGSGWHLILENRLRADFQVGVQLAELPSDGTQVTVVDSSIQDFRVMGGIDFDQFGKTSWTGGDASIHFSKVTSGAACGTITVDLTGSQRTNRMPRTVQTRFEANFWAEIRP